MKQTKGCSLASFCRFPEFHGFIVLSKQIVQHHFLYCIYVNNDLIRVNFELPNKLLLFRLIFTDQYRICGLSFHIPNDIAKHFQHEKCVVMIRLFQNAIVCR
ncbi:hypothetical protein D3C71_1828360 [compost metagenome]